MVIELAFTHCLSKLILSISSNCVLTVINASAVI